MPADQFEDCEIRPGSLSGIARIGEIDRSEDIAIEYECRLAEGGQSIDIVELRRDPPKHIPDWDEEGIQRRTRWWTREVEEGGTIFVAESAGKLIGIAILSTERHHKSAEIVSLFVDRAHRGKGLGRRLMERLEDEARDRGIEAIFVGSNENAGSLGFYRAMGFRIVCLMDPSVVWIPGLETTITLAKKLS